MNKTLVRPIVFFTFACLSCALAAPQLFVGQTQTISGAFLSANGTPAEYPSSVTVRRASDHVAFVIRHDFAPGQALTTKGSPEEPSKIFAGAAIELFLAPFAETPEVYFQFAVNPSNVLYQAKGPDVNWRPAKKVATSVDISSNSWAATFVIPLGAFGEKPLSENIRWGANFVCGGANWSGIGDLHSPLTFGHVVFTNAEQKADLSSLSLKDGILHFTVIPGSARPDTVSVNDRMHPLPPSGAATFSLSLSTVVDANEIAHKDLVPLDIDIVEKAKPLVSVKALASSGFPDWLVLDKFYYEATNRLSLTYALDCGMESPDIAVRGLAGKVHATFPDQPAKGILTLEDLPEGQYVFEACEKGKTTSCQFAVVGSTSPTPSYTSLCLDPKVPRTLFARDANGGLMPIYPVLGDGLSSILPISSCLSYGFTRTPTAGFLFDKAQATTLYGAEAQLGRIPANSVVLNRIGYEAQMAVFLKEADGEISICPSGAKFFKSVYDSLKAKYPEKLFSIQIDSQIDPEIFASACDVFETAFWGSSYSATMLQRLPGDLSSLRAFAGEKPTLLWLGGSIPSGRIRTADELNAAVHLCILRGVSGNVVHLGHGGVPKDRTRVWSFLKGIEAETAKWYGDWIRAEKVEIAAGGQNIEWEARRAKDGRTLLLAVNTSPFSRTFDYADPTTGTRHSVRLPGYGVFLRP